jgi:hypothetical protein
MAQKRFRESEMSIETAILIATKAHRGQTDLGGNPYILHPLRVMLHFASPNIPAKSPYRQSDYMLAAMLHDVVEDSDWTLEQLLDARLPLSVIEAVDQLSRRKTEGETYGAYIDRLSHSPLAVAVKLQDIADNSVVYRLQPQDIKKYAGLLERDYRVVLKLLGQETSEQERARLAVAKATQKKEHQQRAAQGGGQ